MSTTPIEVTNSAMPTTSESPSTELDRQLGVTSIVFMVVAAAAPLGVVAGSVPLIFATSGTVTAPLYFAAAAIVLLLFAVGFTRMSRCVHNAGAFYSYIRAGLGRTAGLGGATLAMTCYAVFLVGTNAYVGAATTNLIAGFGGPQTPWWIWSLLSCAVCGWLGYRDIDLSAKVLGVALILEALVIVAMNVAIVAHGGDAGLNTEPINPTNTVGGAIGLGLVFAFGGYFGFEATAVFRSEARNPEKTIPRATYIAVIAIAAFYGLSSWTMALGWGTDKVVSAAEADAESFMLDLTGRYVSPILADITQILIVTSFFACVLSFHNVAARYLFTLGGAGALPRILGQINTTHRAPSNASLTVTTVFAALTLIAILTELDPVADIYTICGGIGTLGLILLMAVTSTAIIVFFRRAPHRGNIWTTLIAPLLALVGLLVVAASVLANFPLIVGSASAAICVGIFVVLAFCVGVIQAIALRHRKPAAWAALADC